MAFLLTIVTSWDCSEKQVIIAIAQGQIYLGGGGGGGGGPRNTGKIDLQISFLKIWRKFQFWKVETLLAKNKMAVVS
jgi:hypothetical protein